MSMVAFLENYWSRDQVVRTIQYGTQALSGICAVMIRSKIMEKHFLVISNSISNMRIINRFFDDVPSLRETLRCFRNVRQRVDVQKVLELVSAVAYQLYYPVEHMAWMADVGIVSYSSESLWSMACYLWGIGILASLISHLRKLIKSCIVAWQTRKTHIASKAHNSSATNYVVSYSSIFTAALNVIQCTADLLIAIEYSYIHGRLWPKKPSVGNVLIGLLGLLSSIIGLFKIMPTTQGYFTRI